jgi:ketosteroid isomerase-like protein
LRERLATRTSFNFSRNEEDRGKAKEMTSDESEVRAAAVRFYAAIEAMCRGEGLDPMDEAWEHAAGVTSGHPSGGWAQGWDEVFTTWKVFAAFGREDRGGSQIRDLEVHVCGNLAYTTCTFVASPAFGGGALACTNVLHKENGAWKIIHHHADKSPTMATALEKLAQEG